jgi:hypothetical protein
MIIYYKNEEYSYNFNGELPKGTRIVEFSCLSTDTKPTQNLVQGSLALEADTGDLYVFDGTAWNKQ